MSSASDKSTPESEVCAWGSCLRMATGVYWEPNVKVKLCEDHMREIGRQMAVESEFMERQRRGMA